MASQLGVPFDQARYLGPPGLCPMCHLDLITLHPALASGATTSGALASGAAAVSADVECVTCGARGHLDSDLTVTWTDLATSVISMDEKRAHSAEIQQTAARHAPLRDQIDKLAREWDPYDPVATPAPPSQAVP